MRLKRVKIKGYKNLNDFDCEFPDSHIVAFIGNNGSVNQMYWKIL